MYQARAKCVNFFVALEFYGLFISISLSNVLRLGEGDTAKAASLGGF